MDNSVTVEGIRKTIFGAGSLAQIRDACKALRAGRALLVMDEQLPKIIIAIEKAARVIDHLTLIIDHLSLRIESECLK